MKELREESKLIIERINREQDENEMHLYSKIGNQNQLLSEKSGGSKSMHFDHQ
jgi:hypothetical protein